jgi:hypothetical protein
MKSNFFYSAEPVENKADRYCKRYENFRLFFFFLVMKTILLHYQYSEANVMYFHSMY